MDCLDGLESVVQLLVLTLVWTLQVLGHELMARFFAVAGRGSVVEPTGGWSGADGFLVF